MSALGAGTDSDDALPSGARKVALVRSMFDTIAPRYDLVNRLMTFGLDRRWRRLAIGALALAPGSLVLDLACGTADFARELTGAGYRSFGVDLSLQMLLAARSGGAPLLEGDAVDLPVAEAALDGVVSGFAIRNFADLAAVFAELARVVRPGGRLVVLEVDEPRNPLVRSGHALWFRLVVPRIGALLSDASAYRYLPRSVAYLPSRRAFESLLEGAGFVDVRRIGLAGGAAQILSATRVGATSLLER